MKKMTLCVLVFFFSAKAAFSQYTGSTEIGFGLDFGVPVGNFGLKTNPGFGGDAHVGYNFTKNWGVVVTAGYMAFFTTEKLNDQNIGTIGDGFFKVSGRYIFKNGFYLQPGLGFSQFSSGRVKDIGGNGLTLAGQAGFYANKAKTFDFSVRYEATNNDEAIHFVGVRVGYRLTSNHSF